MRASEAALSLASSVRPFAANVFAFKSARAFSAFATVTATSVCNPAMTGASHTLRASHPPVSEAPMRQA